MKVYFSHGLEGNGPDGSKIKRLSGIAEKLGYGVARIDYQDLKDPDLRVERLLSALEKEDDDVILVGSSMGGYVSLVAAETVGPKGVFLLAPALYMEGYKQQDYSAPASIEIVHGWSDETIPPDNSIRLARAANCPLHLIPGNHRLDSSIETVARLFTQFLMYSKPELIASE